jgi:hypothetical protein
MLLSWQILQRVVHELTVEVCDWVCRAEGHRSGYRRILSAREKADIRRGGALVDAESTGLHFPLHELVAREFQPP